MKKVKSDSLFQWRSKYMHSLLAVLVLCLFFMTVELPRLFVDSPFPPTSTYLQGDDWLHVVNDQEWRPLRGDFSGKQRLARQLEHNSRIATDLTVSREQEDVATINLNTGGMVTDRNLNKAANVDLIHEERPLSDGSGPSAIPDEISKKENGKVGVKNSPTINRHPVSILRKAANLAWKKGRMTWKELEAEVIPNNESLWQRNENNVRQSCSESISMDGQGFDQAGRFMPLPCGMIIGSSLTIVGKPRPTRLEYKLGKDDVYRPQEVSQFIIELHGTKETEGEEPPRILHINPRLRGDWSNKSVIELNTCYRGQWGRSQRCDGSWSLHGDETVDGILKCENWLQESGGDQENPKTSWWFQRLIGRVERNKMKWHYPFTEKRLFVLTIRAGWEGYHVTVDGRHVTSFPHHTGNLDEETTGISVNGDVDLQLVMASSLPPHPKSFHEELFGASEYFRAPPMPDSQVDLFIGILSESSHFSERMAVRKTWLQSKLIKTSKIVARFFVALHSSKDINLQILREAQYYQDMVIVPFMDHYDLVVLKTIAICEYGVRNVSTRYILKCDDDTFVKVDAVMNEVRKAGSAESLYLGSINMYHRPLRTGKWAVTLEEWAEEVYPFYANGAGYIISRDVAKFVLFQHKKRNLELFKMEDVSMGVWVMQFNTTNSVKYVNTWKFCQDGCGNGCVTAHYQSPRQMLCMWKKLLTAKAYCCNR